MRVAKQRQQQHCASGGLDQLRFKKLHLRRQCGKAGIRKAKVSAMQIASDSEMSKGQSGKGKNGK